VDQLEEIVCISWRRLCGSVGGDCVDQLEEIVWISWRRLCGSVICTAVNKG